MGCLRERRKAEASAEKTSKKLKKCLTKAERRGKIEYVPPLRRTGEYLVN